MEETPRDQDEDRRLLHQCLPPSACSPLPKLLPPPPSPRRLSPIPDHPPYSEMVQVALRALAEAGGSTIQAISDYISASFTGLPSGHSRLLPYYLRKLLAVGDLSMPSPGRFLLRHFPPSQHPPCARTPNLKSCPKPRRGGQSSALVVSGDALGYPRRRGRPPNALPPSPRLGSTPENPPCAPRRRGRPRKNPIAVPAPVPRGRGRPRKNPPAESPIMQPDIASVAGAVIGSKPFVRRKMKRPSSDCSSMDIDNGVAVGDKDDKKKLLCLLTLSQPSENHIWKPSVLDAERSKSNEPWLPLLKYELEENSMFPSLTQTAADGELVWELPRMPEPEAELWLPYVMPLAASLPEGTSVPARLHEESSVLFKLPEASLPPADQHEESSMSGKVLEKQLVLAVHCGESSPELPEELQAVDELHKEYVMPTELSEKPLVPAKLNDGLSMSAELTDKSSTSVELDEESLPLIELPEKPSAPPKLHEGLSVSAGLSEKPWITSKLHEEPRMPTKLFEKRSPLAELYEQPSMLAEQHETLMPAEPHEESEQPAEIFVKSSILLELHEEPLMPGKLHDEPATSDKFNDEPLLLAEMQEKPESESESLSVSVPNRVKPEEASNGVRQDRYQPNEKSSIAAPFDNAEMFHHEEQQQYESQGEQRLSAPSQNAPDEQFSSTSTTPASREIQRGEVSSKRRRSQAKCRKLWFE